jgi:hypothetical protein
MKNTIIILSLLIITSCSSRATGKYEFPMHIETFDSNKKRLHHSVNFTQLIQECHLST